MEGVGKEKYQMWIESFYKNSKFCIHKFVYIFVDIYYIFNLWFSLHNQ